MLQVLVPLFRFSFGGLQVVALVGVLPYVCQQLQLLHFVNHFVHWCVHAISIHVYIGDLPRSLCTSIATPALSYNCWSILHCLSEERL
jgi:hypothetical protein